MKTKKSFWKKVFSLQVFFFIVLPVITLLLIVYRGVMPIRPYPTNNISKRITIIKDSFIHKDITNKHIMIKISPDGDSVDYIKIYKVFLIDVLDICDQWICLDTITFTEQVENDPSFNQKIEKYKNNSLEIIGKMQAPIDIGEILLLTPMFQLDHQYNDEMDKYFDKIYEMHTSMTQMVKYKGFIAKRHFKKVDKFIHKGDCKKSIREVRQIKGNKKYYIIDEEFFDYCIRVKDLCDKIINNY